MKTRVQNYLNIAPPSIELEVVELRNCMSRPDFALVLQFFVNFSCMCFLGASVSWLTDIKFRTIRVWERSKCCV